MNYQGQHPDPGHVTRKGRVEPLVNESENDQTYGAVEVYTKKINSVSEALSVRWLHDT